MERVADLLAQSSRPLVWAGYGIRLAGEAKRFREFIDRTRLPCVTTWGGADLLPTDHPLNCGIVGVCGQRGANRAVAACDFLLALGSHLSLPQTGPVESFAPNARRIAVVDIDKDELDHIESGAFTKICVESGAFTKICAHLGGFFDGIHEALGKILVSSDEIDRWSQIRESFRQMNIAPAIGSYAFNATMTRMLPERTCMVIDGGGTALYTGFQSSYIKEGSRLICSMAMSAMGSGLPEAVGACLANGGKLTTCIIGDGSLMLNLQELQTIRTLDLPIKIFVINNGGYLAIRHTQKAFQEGRYYGVGGDDLEFPSLGRIAACFDLPYWQWIPDHCQHMLDEPGPMLIDVHCPHDQPMLRQGFKDGKPLPLTRMVIE